MKRSAVMAWISVLCVQSLAAWDGSPNLEPNLSQKDVLLFEDFESLDYAKRWLGVTNRPVGAGMVTGPSEDVFAGKRSLYLLAKQGKHSSVGAVEYMPSTPLNDVAYMRLYLRFDDDFSIGTCNQVKLFGIHGGAALANTYGGAGRRPNGKDKFSALVSIDRRHELHLYAYHPEQRGGWGDMAYCDGFFCSAAIDPGRWYCVELMLKPNSPGQQDGETAVWVDNKRVIHVDKLRFRDTGEVRVRRFVIENYFGGGGRWNTSPQDQNTYIDNLVISRERIGCLGNAPREN